MKTLFRTFLMLTLILMMAAYKFPEAPSAQPDERLSSPLKQLSDSLSALAEQAQGALVLVSVLRPLAPGQDPGMQDPLEYFFALPQGESLEPGLPPQEGVGSGFIVDLEHGYIMTNNHVIEGAEKIELKFANGKSYAGEVVGTDASTDIAVVRIKDRKFGKEGLTALRFIKQADNSKVGDLVVALGAPFGLEASLSLGVISALGRGSLGITKVGNFIQTDASINPGHSGGPLLNSSGEVIGVNTAIFTQSGSCNGVGFAVPASLAVLVGERLVSMGKVERGYLGVSLKILDKSLKQFLRLPSELSGALIASVEKGSPAGKAGLVAGAIITSVDGQKVTGPEDLAYHLSLQAPGKKAHLEYFHEGRQKKLDVVLGSSPKKENPVTF